VSRQSRARRWLRLDAGYCGAGGVLAVVLASPLSRLFHVPAALIVTIGVSAVIWACVLVVLARRGRWRRPLTAVSRANAAASAAMAALAAFAPEPAARALLAAVAVEVAAFAAIQLRLLRERD
jgi:hypothetical protein